MKTTIAIYAFSITFFILLVVFRYVWSRKRIRDRFSHLVDIGVADEEIIAQKNGLRSIIEKASVHFESNSWAIKKEIKLIQADIPFKGSEFLVVSLLVTVASIAIVLLLTGGNFIISILGGGIMFLFPSALLNMKIKKRRSLIDQQLPDALTMMANSLRSGYSYMRAIDLAAKEIPEPLGKEFAIVMEETNLGITTEESLNNLAQRVGTEDMELTVTAFLIQRQLGGNLAELLDNIASTIRSRIKMKEKVKTLTAQGKLSAFVLCSLPFAAGVMMYLLNPEYMSFFFGKKLGIIMIGLGVLGQILGILWMKKIVNIGL